MTEKEKKSKIADILMDFQEEYSNEVVNRPMLASLYAGNLLSFIDSLQEELASEDLEEACEKLAENARKHKAETLSPFFSPTDYKQGVIDGAKWQKEQMMKDATEVEVKIDAGGYPYIPAVELYDYDNDVPLAKAGDKVKVKIIKED